MRSFITSIAVIQSILYQVTTAQGTCKETHIDQFTFYGFPDGGNTLSFSCPQNGGKGGGGTGTYANPEGFATSMSNKGFTECEIVYIPYFQKYFQYSDHCVSCDQEYTSTQKLHIDLWIGPDQTTGPNQLLCEQTFGSIEGQTIIQSPPSNLPVNAQQLWDGTCHTESVYKTPSTQGLCSGAGGSSGGSPSVPSVASVASVTQPSITPSVIPVPERVALPPPTTMITAVSSSSTSSTSSSPPASTTTVAVGVTTTGKSGVLGDTCQSFSDCTGDWICMGIPKTCHDNKLD